MSHQRAFAFALSLLSIAWTVTIPAAEPSADTAADAIALCRSIGRGINLGNGLEAPSEGAWGYKIEDEHLRLIKEAGFNSVRIPIRWSARAAGEPPYEIDPKFFGRVDHVLDEAAKHGLVAILNVHHYDELYRDPGQAPAAAAGDLAANRRSLPRPPGHACCSNCLNEPNAKLDDKKWNDAVTELSPIVRASNPTRGVIVGPASWNNVNALAKLELPARRPHADRDVPLLRAVPVHAPGRIVGQRAATPGGDENGPASPEELKRLRDDFDKAAAWGKTTQPADLSWRIRRLFGGRHGLARPLDRGRRPRGRSPRFQLGPTGSSAPASASTTPAQTWRTVVVAGALPIAVRFAAQNRDCTRRPRHLPTTSPRSSSPPRSRSTRCVISIGRLW